MANEGTLTYTLRVANSGDAPAHQPPGRRFSFDVTGTGGPYVGTLSVSTSGTDVDLSAVGRPGLAEFVNQDATNYVDVGIHDPEAGVFRPFGRLLPGKGFPIYLCPDLGEEYVGTISGTGTSPTNNTLRLRANTAACKVQVSVFPE